MSRIRGNATFSAIVTADTALRLAHYFKMTPQFWLGLQMDYDLDVEEDKLAVRLKKEVSIYELVHKIA